jgi:hypothetical protein
MVAACGSAGLLGLADVAGAAGGESSRPGGGKIAEFARGALLPTLSFEVSTSARMYSGEKQ